MSFSLFLGTDIKRWCVREVTRWVGLWIPRKHRRKTVAVSDELIRQRQHPPWAWGAVPFVVRPNERIPQIQHPLDSQERHVSVCLCIYICRVIIHNFVCWYALIGFGCLKYIPFWNAMGFNFNVACFGIELVSFDLTWGRKVFGIACGMRRPQLQLGLVWFVWASKLQKHILFITKRMV